jgi:hypothetical protein
MRARAALALTVAAIGCSPYQKSLHPLDIENEAPLLSSGECAGVDLIKPETIFSGPWMLSVDRPSAGSLIAIDAYPAPGAFCNKPGGGSWLDPNPPCHNASCVSHERCGFVIHLDAHNFICMSNPGFACGGTDCGMWCSPFSTTPAKPYRLVGRMAYHDFSTTEPAETVSPAELMVERWCVHD